MTALLAFLRAGALGASACAVLALTATWGAQAQQRVYQRSGAHFVVMFEGPADEAVAFRALEMLEAAYYRVGSTLNVYPPEPVEVVLHTREQFRDVTKAPEWSGGVYDGRIRIPIKDADRSPEQLAEVLAHEYTHAVVASLADGPVPAWLNEGLAGVMEPNGSRDEIEALARAGLRIPLSQLAESFRSLPAEQVSIAYAQSAAAVQRMIQLRGAPAVVTLIRGLDNDAPFETAFQSALGMRFQDFEGMVAR